MSGNQKKKKGRGPRPKARGPKKGSGGPSKNNKRKGKTGSNGDTARSIGSSIGKALGNVLGGGAGATAGSFLGKAAGSLFHKITGFGDYKVSSNTLMAPASADSLPSFVRSGRGMKVLHREYLTDIKTSSTVGAYALQTFAIQPAIIQTFPWLANIAANFEEYTINGMIFEFKSNSYDALASTNTASGTVIMTTQYNVLAPVFVNKIQMEQYEFTCSAKPSVDIMHPVECARGESPVSVLSTRVAGDSVGDLRLYDFGNFNIATVGMQGANTNIGELWISYDITLWKPRTGAVIYPADLYQLDLSATVGSTAATHQPFGTTPPVLAVGSSLGSVLGFGTQAANINNRNLIIPKSFTGLLQVEYQLGGTAQTATVPAGISGSSGATVMFTNFIPTATAGTYQQIFYVNCVNGGIITWNLAVATWGPANVGNVNYVSVSSIPLSMLPI